MTAFTPIERIGQMLENAGYQKLSSPLRIAGLSFDIPAAYIGTLPSPDLVLVADTAFEPDRLILRKVEGIGRALDVAGSKRPVTTVLAGPRPNSDIIDALTKVSRVLPIGTSLDDDFESSLRNWLAVLLPLTVPAPNSDIANPLNEISAHLEDLDASIADLVHAAVSGADIIQSHLHTLLNKALESDGDNP